MSYRGEISIPVRSESRHFWNNSNDDYAIRRRFDEERRRMEAEMNRLKQKFHREDSAGPSRDFYSSDRYRPREAVPFYDENIRAPVIPIQQPPISQRPEWRVVETGRDGSKWVNLKFDMADYRPDEIQVFVDRDTLRVKAKHEESNPNRSCYREYNREFTLPSAINSNQITSHLSRDGILTVEAPLPYEYPNRNWN